MSNIPSKRYNKLKESHPQVINAVESLREVTKQAGPLPDKTIHLIQLAAAAAIRSEGAVHSHTRRALEAGAEPDEIYQAVIVLISTLGFPTAVAALSWVDDILEK